MNNNWDKWEKTNKIGEIWLNNKLVELEIYYIPIDDLYLYPKNTRFLIEAQQEGLDQAQLTDKGTQTKLEKIIWNKYPKENKKTLESLKKHGLKDAIYVYGEDGTVLSGNRRTTLLKKLNKENPTDKKFKKVKAFVHKEKLSEIEKKSYELTMQYEPEQKIDYTRLNRMLSSAEVHKELSPYKSDTEIAKIVGYGNKTKLLKDIGELKLLQEYISYYNDGLSEELKVSLMDFDKEKYLNILDTLYKTVSKLNDAEIIKKTKNAMFNLMILDKVRALDIRAAFSKAYKDINEPSFYDFHENINKNITNDLIIGIKNKNPDEEKLEEARTKLRYSFMQISADSISLKTPSSNIKELKKTVNSSIEIMEEISSSHISKIQKDDLNSIFIKVKKLLKIINKKLNKR